MRILVTGGAGFIGKHLCRKLKGEGHEVWSMDIAYGVHRPTLLTDEATGVNAINAAVHDSFAWTENGQLEGDWDRIYHLACHASPNRYQENPIDTSATCVQGTWLAAGWARQKNCRILLASTSEIYGEPEIHPQPESYRGNVNCLGPRACYDEGKRMAECLMMDYHRKHGVDTRIARIFNTYGPGMDLNDGRVISNFVTQAIQGDPLTIYGDGTQTRSFCYVDDMVEGLIRLMEHEGPECHEPHNLGNPMNDFEGRIIEIAYSVLGHVIGWNKLPREILWKEKYLEYHPLPQDDPTRRCPDITRAKRNLGWEPKVSLGDGLKRTVEDFRARLKSNRLDSKNQCVTGGVK